MFGDGPPWRAWVLICGGRLEHTVSGIGLTGWRRGLLVAGVVGGNGSREKRPKRIFKRLLSW